MIKTLTLIGTRPELIKMSRVIHELDKNFNNILVHSGQNYDYELNEIFFDDLEIRKPDYFLEISNKSTIESISDVIKKIDNVLKKEKPDAFLIYGDTNTSFATIAAKKRKVPIFHMEAGNRCHDMRVPEELNRKIVDHVSDVNLVLTEHARRNLILENFPNDRIFKTGSHLGEVLNYYRPKINKSKILKKLKLQDKKYFLFSAHREENIDDKENFKNLLSSIKSLSKVYKLPIIISTHPRTKKNLVKYKELKNDKMIRFFDPFCYTDYIKLQQSAFCVISDSGTITEETSLLNLNSITIRNAQERPEGMDSSVLIMSGLKESNILDSVKIITSQNNKKNRNKIVPDYEISHLVSEQVCRIVMSYFDYVNKKVWFKLD